MVFLRTLAGKSVALNLKPTATVAELKAAVAELESVPSEDQRILLAGHQLDDDELTLAECGVEDLSTLDFELRLLGGGKKRKKKVFATPKKVAHKRKKVKLGILRFYTVADDGTIKRNRVECTGDNCGGGIFMAKHSDRHYCGKCHTTLVENKK